MGSYKLDMHVHTADVSRCGMIKAEEVVRLYETADYDGIVITDHFYQRFFKNLSNMSWKKKVDNYLQGYVRALEAGEKYGIDVFLGMELRFLENRNEYLIYGIDENFLYNHPDFYKMDLTSFKELLKEERQKNNVLIYQAHPFRNGMTIVEPDLLDGIEVFNGNPRHNSRNKIAYMFAAEHGLKMISASDFHQKEDLGAGGVILPEKIKTMDDIVSTIKENEIEKLLNVN